MPRRTPPQAKADDLAFPVRVKIVVPERCLGKTGDAMDEWLKRELLPGNYACHSAGIVAGQQATAVYFRSAADAEGFVATFPELELADGTASPGYRSPAAPIGRRSAR